MNRDSPPSIENRIFKFSQFSNQFDNSPLTRELRYSALVNLFGIFHVREEKGGLAFAPVSYSEPRRANKNVENVTLAVVDYDDGTTIQHAQKRFEPFECLLYTSFSHTPEHHRFRVVFPLEKPIPAMEWQHAWLHLAKIAPGLDEACKDLARIYYLPTHRPGAEHLSLRNEGKLLDLPTTPPVATRKSQRRGWTRMKVCRNGQIEKARFSDRVYGGAAHSLEEWLEQHRVDWTPLKRGGSKRYLGCADPPMADGAGRGGHDGCRRTQHRHAASARPGGSGGETVCS